MREATFVRGLVIERVRMVNRDELRYQMWDRLPSVASDGTLLLTEDTGQERIIPITEFCYGNGKPTVYLAYSEEVESLLGLPFRVILKEKEQAIAERNRLLDMTAWQHIKKAFWLITKRSRP